MNGIFGIGVWIRMTEIVLPLIAVLWADTVLEWYWPTLALGARTRWRNAQKRLIEPFLPLNAERAGPIGAWAEWWTPSGSWSGLERICGGWEGSYSVFVNISVVRNNLGSLR